MRIGFPKAISLICAVCLAAALLCMTALAKGTGASASGYKDVQIYTDGLLTSRGYMAENTTYVSLTAVCGMVKETVDTEETANTEETGAPAAEKTAAIAENETPAVSAGKTAEPEDGSITAINVAGITVSYTAGDEYLTANGRYLYVPGGARVISGEQCFPVRTLAKIFGLEVSWYGEKAAVELSTENMQVLESGDTFYDAADHDLLAHIIYAEAGNQCMAGKIGVGNVVLNRVSSERFPNTVRDVIYAPGQFEPVQRGTINSTANPESVIAAYIAMEGYNTVSGSLFFHNPGSSTGYLSDSDFVVRIQDHVFFA